MTTLDPSHFPWRAHDSDPTKGGAVHTSVRAPFASTSKARYASSSDLQSCSEDDDIDADEHFEHFQGIKRRRRARRDKKRLDHEDARAHGRIPTIPVPDVRFEQSYLMSIQPFIHSRPTQQASATPSVSDSEGKEDVTITNAPSKLRRDKRRRVEESLALVDDPASRKGGPLDELLHPSSGRQVSIQWSQIAYITLRDQVFSPLVQGALWAFGGIILSSIYSGWKTSYPSDSTKKKPKGTIAELRGYLSRLVGPALAGIRAGPQNP